jgi:hypothetical protein
MFLVFAGVSKPVETRFGSFWVVGQKRLSRRKNQYYHHVGGVHVFALLFPSGKYA